MFTTHCTSLKGDTAAEIVEALGGKNGRADRPVEKHKTRKTGMGAKTFRPPTAGRPPQRKTAASMGIDGGGSQVVGIAGGNSEVDLTNIEPASATAATIASALGGRWTGSDWRCRCPVRRHRQSLIVSEGSLGLILRCSAGCAPAAVARALQRRLRRGAS